MSLSTLQIIIFAHNLVTAKKEANLCCVRNILIISKHTDRSHTLWMFVVSCTNLVYSYFLLYCYDLRTLAIRWLVAANLAYFMYSYTLQYSLCITCFLKTMIVLFLCWISCC